MGRPKLGIRLKVNQQPLERPHLEVHGAYKLVRCYYLNAIDRRSSIGKLIAVWEREFAAHLSYNRLEDAPVTVKEKVRLAIGNRLFQMAWLPGAATNGKEIRASENTLNRILTEFGLKSVEKPIDAKRVFEEYAEAQ